MDLQLTSSILFCLIIPASAYNLLDYCEGETFTAKCEADEVIFMTSARYGRMSLGRCIKYDYGNIGCSSDVLPTLDTMCSGRRSCEVRVSSIVDIMRSHSLPCNRDLRSYLETSYKCVKVGPARAVCGREAYMVLNATSGYLASVLTEETQAGSIHCPWVIKAKPGQRINITMYDFAVAESTPSLSSFIDPCSVVYATLKEPDITSTATHRLCNSEKRVSHAYESFTDNVEVRIFTEEASPKRKYFLLYYQVIGCEDMKPPPNTILERNGNLLKLRCNGTSHWYDLKCVDTKWTGEIPACPASVNVASSTEFSIVIIASVAIIIASAVLTVGLLCIKRRRDNMIRLAQRKYEEGSIYYAQGRKGDPRAMSHGVPGMPGDPYQANENDYFRTWQLQRHAQARGGLDMDYPSHTVRSMDDSKFAFGHHHVEHIYESPKFDRRDVQYFELDPSACGQPDGYPPLPDPNRPVQLNSSR